MRRLINRLLVTLAGTALLAVGCGGNASPAASPGASAAPVSLTIGVVGVIDVAPLYLGIQKGFFSAQNLTITPKVFGTGALVVSGVVSGDLPIGFSNNTSIVIASSQNFPVRIVAAGNQAGPGDYSTVLVKPGSSIATPQDLAGKKIAVNGLKNVGSLVVNAALENLHVDISKIQYVEIPFPQMGAALQQGTVDAVWTVEPFSSIVKGAGNKVVLTPMTQIEKNFPVASYFTTTTYAQSHPDVVARFKTAINQSLAYSQSHPSEVRAVVPTYIPTMAPSLVNTVILPAWSSDPQRTWIQKTSDLAYKYGYTTKKANMTQLFGS